MSYLLQEFAHSPRDVRLYELAKQYHMTCEAYDRTVCTGPVTADGIMPANHRELALINRHAIEVMRGLLDVARADGIGPAELRKAISRYDGPKGERNDH